MVSKRGRFSFIISLILSFSLVFFVFSNEKHTEKAAGKHEKRQGSARAQKQPYGKQPHHQKSEKAKQGANTLTKLKTNKRVQDCMHRSTAVKSLNGEEIEQAK
jgi:hypothetical protein